MASAYPYTGLITIIMLLIYFWTAMRVGKARGKYGVKAPATTGPEEFNLVYRGHVNTLEQLVLTLPALWLFAAFVGDLWAGLAGLVWVIGRLIYVTSYGAAADKRSTGFMIGMLATACCLMGALISIGWYIIKEM